MVKRETHFFELRKRMYELTTRPQDQEANRIEGQRFLQALVSISMDFGDENIRRRTPSDSALGKLWSSFHRSLQPVPYKIDASSLALSEMRS